MNLSPDAGTNPVEYYAHYDDVQLRAVLAARGVQPPDEATRDQMLASLTFFPLPGGPSRPDAVVLAGPPPDGQPLTSLNALTKDQLVEKARVEFGYEMAQNQTKAQMIEMLGRLAPTK
jgi:hypothetical protein